jgi:peptidoglycan-associated lipoprotein
MKPQRRTAHACLLVADALVVIVFPACGQTAIMQPRAPEMTSASEGGTTTTTNAAVNGPSTAYDVHVSDEIMRACGVRFPEMDQAPRFDFDRSDLKSDEAVVLSQVAACLTTGPLKGRRLRLVGHTDPRGEAQYNFSLGEDRAARVERYLNALGVDATRIQAISRGKLDATGTDEVGWHIDRRVDVELQ